jgi:trigger factor
MNILELKKDDLNLHIKVIIPTKEINDTITKELTRIGKTAKMDGFRVGKVPPHILKKKYFDSLFGDVARNKISESVTNITKERKLRTVIDPQVEDLKIEKDQDLEFVLKFQLLPEISMPDFSKVTIEKPMLKVSKENIEAELDRLAGFSKIFEKETKGKAKIGDQLTIDAVGYVDGEAFEGGKLTSHKLVLGSNAFIPGFEDQLVGSKAGEDVLVKVTFPEQYQAKNLAGKSSEFKVKVLAVHNGKLPDIDDEFAKGFNCKTIEELKEKISDNLEHEYDNHIHVFIKMKLFDKLEDLLKFEVPEVLLQRELEILKKQAVEMEDDPSIADKSEKEKEKYYTELASRRVKLGLMLAEYVQKNSISIEENDLKTAIIAQARNYPGYESQVIEFYSKDRNALESLKGPILEEKAVKAILDKEIKITEKAYNKEKLEALIELEKI